MKARPLRRVVPADGRLPVEITIRNLTDSLVWFHRMFVAGANLRADIVGPDGRTVPLTAAIDPPGPANFGSALVPPGGSLSDTVDLNCDLPVPDRQTCIAPYDLSRPGEYRIGLDLRLPLETERRGEMLTFTAEPFTVQVREDDRAEERSESPADPPGVTGCYGVQVDTSGTPLPKWGVAGIPNPFKLPSRISLTPRLEYPAGTWRFTVLPAAWNGDGLPPPMGAYIEAGSDSLVLATVNGIAGLKGTFRRLDTDTLVGMLRFWSDDGPGSQGRAWPAALSRVDCVTGRPVGKAKPLLYRR
ncbi:MAG: hypothetical protein P8174_08065 [Gemmatimonadota bacterium]